MHKLGLLLCCCLLVSCDFFTNRKVSREEIVREEMKSINWNDVDRYPLFESCDETSSRAEQRICFQKEFVNHFYKTLSNHQLVVRRDIEDTVKVHLLIDNTGKISLISVNKSKETERQLPALDGLMELTVSRLPKVYPALKRDIPVSTRVVMPVVLRVN
ncbi:energy transducer TonB [Robertkochia flava]|uniref:hypothetical protein n=1 Tax=Robertkochia flava TaxID=3447986 RepID=UPI001CCC020E|nr:hypothetical protein [Robertkochia marina]